MATEISTGISTAQLLQTSTPRKKREGVDILGFAAVKRQVLGVGNTALIGIPFLFTDTSWVLYESFNP